MQRDKTPESSNLQNLQIHLYKRNELTDSILFSVPQVFPSSWNVHANSTPLALYAGDFDNSTVIQADTRVSLLATYPSASLDFTPILRATQVYDGPSINSTHLGKYVFFLTHANIFTLHVNVNSF